MRLPGEYITKTFAHFARQPNHMNNSLLIRYSEARALAGLSKEDFQKIIAAEVIEAKYLVWQVRDARGMILFETSEAKAKAEAQRIGGRAEPLGRAYYLREQIVKLTTANK